MRVNRGERTPTGSQFEEAAAEGKEAKRSPVGVDLPGGSVSTAGQTRL